MLTRWTNLTLLLVLLATVAGAASSREVTRHYDIYDLKPDGCQLFARAGSVCLGVLPGEFWTRIEVREESPTASLGYPIAGILSLDSIPNRELHFCDTIESLLPPGTTAIRVEIQQGRRSGFCDSESDDLSPAWYGSVKATLVTN